MQHPLARARQLMESREDRMVSVNFDPKGPGVARIFLIPPKPGLGSRDSLLLINQWTVTVSPSWARLLRIFIEELNEKATVGMEIAPDTLVAIVKATAAKMAGFYPKTPRATFEKDLDELVSIILAVARGQDVPPTVFQGKTLEDYAQYLNAPLRMDLMVSSMRNGGKRACPLHCGACYAEDQPLMDVAPMDYSYWIQAIRILGRIGVPELTFTGGEPLTREDIVKLVAYAQWHLTRLNTSGVLLTQELALALFKANLDAIQITLYSGQSGIHDGLVGKPGAWGLTVAGIGNALAANLLTSVNTPLLLANRDYAATLRFLAGLGIRYVSCSGLIPTGGATKQTANGAAMNQEQMFQALAGALAVARELGMELNFTSPGILTNQQLVELGMQVPVCGACLENMAISPRGMVVPCQSSLRKADVLGDFLGDKWSRIWNSAKCKGTRKSSAGKNVCPLGERGAK
ncbi:MAG: radical SAM protein [Patescibacteria group bacterium]